MDAFQAMQLHSLLVFSFVVIAFLFRLIVKQLCYSLHHKCRYEHQLQSRVSDIQHLHSD